MNQWDELLETLAELRDGLPDMPVRDDPLYLAAALPGVIGNALSGDPRRVAAARETMAGLRQRLAEAGVELDDRFTALPDRLAELRDGLRP